jgi:hypothetical protein
MSDHWDGPGQDPRIDITDIFVFHAPGDDDTSVLIMDVNPDVETHPGLHPDAIYEWKIDTDGDYVADIAFRITFADGNSGPVAMVRRAEGPMAAGRGRDGETLFERVPVTMGREPHVACGGGYKFAVGLRSDPFFFDREGTLTGFKFHDPGTDYFIARNIYGIALELPNRLLGPNPRVNIWGRVLIPTTEAEAQGAVLHHDDGLFSEWFQAERVGRGHVNTLYMNGDDHNLFNQIEPTADRSTRTVDAKPRAGVTFLESVALTLQQYGRDAEEAARVAEMLLPDVLTYDYTNASPYPNGRGLTDDEPDFALALLTNGQHPTDFVGPHTDLLPDFPYCGPPHE